MVLVAFAAGPAAARAILWTSDAGRVNLTSTGAAMDGGFEFQLGVFAAGFEPAPANIARWPGEWRRAGSAVYSVASQRFSGQLQVTSNAAPFAAGAKAWVFGRRDGAGGSEWILFRADHWLWPAADPMNPLALDWNAKDSTVVLLGEVNGSGSPFLMKSAPTTPPPLKWSEWQTAELAGHPLPGPYQDADSDGVANIFEFLFGTSPIVPGPPPLMPVQRIEIGGSRYVQLSVPRRADREAELVVEVSGDLVRWDSGPAFTVVVSETTESLVVRDLLPLGPADPKRFIRLRAVIPEP